MDKVSVIMATCNTERRLLDESIGSILGQSYKNFELIIVCDGSKDEFQYISSSFHDERIRILFNKKNMGLPFSLNKAIREASGKYIARMDSDDVSFCTRIEEQLEYLDNNNLDICGTAARLIGNERGKKGLLFNSPEDIRVQILFRAALIHPTVMGKREIFVKHKYDEKYGDAEDFELWSRLSDKYAIGVYGKCLLNYRVHAKQVSKKRKRSQQELSRKIIKNNATKITGNYDDRIFECLWALSGRGRVDKSNYQRISKLIDYVLEENCYYKNFDPESAKRVFYNRFFELLLKNKVIVKDLCSLKKITRFYNLSDAICYLLNKLKLSNSEGKHAKFNV